MCRVDPRKETEKWKENLILAYKYLRTLHDRVLVLLTNREHTKLFEREEGVMVQGDEPLSTLVEELREGRIKVLIGLDSLWFGVDIKGEKGILMSKLPFDNPEEPLSYHRMRYLKERGADPFDYMRRKALIKFRQGMGRLMRSKEDRGTIILCDGRIRKFPEFKRAVESLGIRIEYIGW